jgi:hypothetical protein
MAGSSGTVAARPFAVRAELAGGLALLGVMLGMVALGTGWLTGGLVGLAVIGLALGLSGSLRSRFFVAGGLWAATLALAIISAVSGARGFAIAGTVVFAITIVAAGQLAGLAAGVALLLRA